MNTMNIPQLNRKKANLWIEFLEGYLLIVLVVCFHLSLSGQHTVRLMVTDSTGKSEIFIAGGFNGWQPGNPNYRLESLDSIHKTISLQNLPPVRHQFKFTRGTWGTVESSAYTMEIEDRIMDITGDTLIRLSIEGWVDDFVDVNNIPDSLKIQLGRNKSFYYKDKNLDSCIKYATLTYELSHAIGAKRDEMISMIILGDTYQKLGKMDTSLELFLSALQTAEAIKDSSMFSPINENLGNIYKYQGDDQRAKQYYLEALRFTPVALIGANATWSVLHSLSKIFFDTGQLDSAEYYSLEAVQTGFDYGGPFLILGDLDRMAGRLAEAMVNYRKAAAAGFNYNNLVDVADAFQRIGQIFKFYNRPDSAFYYSRNAYELAIQIKNPFIIVSSGILLVDLFEESNHLDSAFIYQRTVLNARDSLYNREKIKQIQSLAFNEQLRRQDIKLARQQFQNKIRIYGLLGIISVFLIIVFMLWRYNRQKQRAYKLLQAQKKETDTQKTFAEQMLDELKTTQKQLIQSEKMASLGELTSGIAHEIKNPLNFINNFSEINMELLQEIGEDQTTYGKTSDSSPFAQTLNNLKKNSEKINLHGKRIDGIVRGMLQHSRLGNLIKEPVNINALCEDALKLAYQGFRSKEKSFNASFETHFDPTLPQILAIPQDISRVMLNLIDNAFYAVNKKYLVQVSHLAVVKNDIPIAPDSAEILKETPGYMPLVSVCTQHHGDRIKIKVSDNGMGIPAAILSKIFQPFFTTKPAGEGTGLGLSMAYDIITKGHGGTITVNSIHQPPAGTITVNSLDSSPEGEPEVKSFESSGTQFEIILPVNHPVKST